ncbi:MAG TPA: gliding motility-associated C-terminal domain-containing protein [Sphingobacterium sp.]|nr:gliding motility-associated C-terminal domain-containing protein [Sphingobacterium sp.]
MLLLAIGQVAAQQGQTLRIVKGKKVTLRADAEQALSYIWFHNGIAVAGLHDSRIVVTEGGVYTVLALGDGCDSELSDPVEIIVDPEAEDVQVDIEIRNLPDRQQAMVSQEFNFQLLALNNSDIHADEVVVTFNLPKQLVYLGVAFDGNGDMEHNAEKNELTWKIPKLNANESISRWIRVQGDRSGEAITIARVSSRQRDRNLVNNEARATVEIVTLFVPNVITPNGDGRNDTFKIAGLESFMSKKLLVFNRFGNEVYRSEDYQNDWNGEGLNEGTYFYYLELVDWTGNVHHDRGYVLLARDINYK